VTHVSIEFRGQGNRALAGLTAHLYDLGSHKLPDELLDPARWNALHREGWSDLRASRLGSTLTDAYGRAELDVAEATGDRVINLWMTATSCEPAEDGLVQVVYVSPEVRIAAGARECYCVELSGERLAKPAPRRVVADAFPGGAAIALAEHGDRIRDEALGEAPPEEVGAFFAELEAARKEARAAGVWRPPRSFAMQLRWQERDQGPVDVGEIGFDEGLGSLARRPGGGQPVALRYRGVRRRVEHADAGPALELDGRGELRLVLPALPGELRVAEPDRNALLDLFDSVNSSSSRPAGPIEE
jgi:hypothetical protein